MVIPFDTVGGIHSLTALLMDEAKYAAAHGGKKFVRPVRLPLYDKLIAEDAPIVVRVRAVAAHKSKLEDYNNYKAAECGCAKFLRDVVDEVWYNDLKDAETFYTQVTALEIMTFLDLNSGGLHAVDMLSLQTNMHQYYTQADGIPQYIIMLEDAQKKAKRADMPIADVELVMMALATVLAAQHFPREVDDWEGLPAASRTWTAWKTVFCLAHLKHQRQILALGGGSHWGAHTVSRRHRSRLTWIVSSLPWTIWRLPPRTTKWCWSSSRLPTWHSLVPLRRSRRPTKNWPTRPAPAQPALRVLLARPEKSPGTRTAAITVGRMAIGSAKSTRVPPASTKQQGTRMMPPSRTRWGVARTIRGGTRFAPDMEGWQMRSIV